MILELRTVELRSAARSSKLLPVGAHQPDKDERHEFCPILPRFVLCQRNAHPVVLSKRPAVGAAVIQVIDRPPLGEFFGKSRRPIGQAHSGNHRRHLRDLQG